MIYTNVVQIWFTANFVVMQAWLIFCMFQMNKIVSGLINYSRVKVFYNVVPTRNGKWVKQAVARCEFFTIISHCLS